MRVQRHTAIHRIARHHGFPFALPSANVWCRFTPRPTRSRKVQLPPPPPPRLPLLLDLMASVLFTRSPCGNTWPTRDVEMWMAAPWDEATTLERARHRRLVGRMPAKEPIPQPLNDVTIIALLPTCRPCLQTSCLGEHFSYRN